MKLHHIIKEYRLLATAITVTFIYLTLDMWEFYKDNHTDISGEGSAAFSALALASIAALKFALENASKRHEKDEHED